MKALPKNREIYIPPQELEKTDSYFKQFRTSNSSLEKVDSTYDRVRDEHIFDPKMKTDWKFQQKTLEKKGMNSKRLTHNQIYGRESKFQETYDRFEEKCPKPVHVKFHSDLHLSKDFTN